MRLAFLILCILYSQQIDYEDDDKGIPKNGYVTVSSSNVCPAYICKESQTKIGCATYSGGQVILESCMGDWYCKWDSTPDSDSPNLYGKCKLRQSLSKYRKNFGDFCYQDSDCKTSYCSLNKCQVKSVGETCSSSYQCGKGFSCDPFTDNCKAWLLDGASCEDNKYLCKPSSGCLTKVGATAKCTQYYSLTNDQLSKTEDGIYDFGMELDDYCISGSLTSESKCSPTSYTLAGGYPKTCNTHSDCPAAEDGQKIGSCMCWPNTKGVKYCVPFPGDIIETFNRKKAWMAKDFSKCHNYEMAYGINNCGGFSMSEDKEWAPQIKAGTWGYCYDSVSLTVLKKIYTTESTDACPAIQCNTGNNDGGRCILYNEGSNTYYAQSCPKDYMCGLYEAGDYPLIGYHLLCKYTLARNSKGAKGDWCWVDSDCYSGVCDNTKVCSVYSHGATCTNSTNCDKGMVCASSSTSSNYICQKWIDIGGACTTKNYYLCRKGLECLSFKSGSTSGTCQAYYSLGSGETAYLMSSIGSVLYESNSFCKSGAWDYANHACFAKSHKLISYPRTCNVSTTDCLSTNSNDKYRYYTSCLCIPNTQGQKYCDVHAADVDSNYFNYIYSYFSRDLSNCYYYELGHNYGGSCGVEDNAIDYWSHSIPSKYLPSCGKDVLYDEENYEKTTEYGIINIYIFSSRLLTSVCLLLGILIFK